MTFLNSQYVGFLLKHACNFFRKFSLSKFSKKITLSKVKSLKKKVRSKRLLLLNVLYNSCSLKKKDPNKGIKK